MQHSRAITLRVPVCSFLVAAVVCGAGLAQGQSISITATAGNPRNTSSIGAYYVPIKTDLANLDQATFSSLTTTYPLDWNGGNQACLNDGNPAGNGYGAGKWNSALHNGGPFPAVQTFIFNTNLNVNGYDISSIISASADWRDGRTWQKYNLEYHTVGGGWNVVTGDDPVGTNTINRPGDPGGNPQQALVMIERLALTRVDQIRFTTPSNGGCTSWSEIDILGAASGDSDIIGSFTGDSDWGTAANWVGGVLPGAGDNAIFNGAGSELTVMPDSTRSVRDITFDTALAGAYVIGTTHGNPLTLSNGGRIHLLPAVIQTQTVNAPLVIAGTNGMYTFTSDAILNSVLLNFGGGITAGAPGTTVLMLDGANAGANTLGGSIDNGLATSVSIAKYGTGVWALSGSNTYTGTTLIGGGILQANDTSALGNGDITFTGGTLQFGSAFNGTTQSWGTRIKNSILSGAITLDLNGQNVTLDGAIPASNTGGLTKSGEGRLILPGVNNYSGATFINGGTIEIVGSGQLGSGNYDSAISIVGGALLHFTTSANQTLAGGALSGLGGLTWGGAGTLTLTGTRLAASPTLTVTNGSLSVSTANSLGIGPASDLVLDGGILRLGEPSGGNSNPTARLFTLGVGGTTLQPLNLDQSTNTRRLEFNGPGPIAFTGSGDRFLKFESGVMLGTRFAPAIGDGPGGVTGVVVGGTPGANGTWTLEGVNTYTGTTTINGGSLSIRKQQSVNGGVAYFTPANLAVVSGACLAVGVGLAPEYFDAAAIASILDNSHLGGSAPGTGLKAGAQFGMDSTAGDFIYSANLTDLSGGNVLNLAKHGINVLTLSGNNTYTGTTTIYGDIGTSTLRAGSPTAFGQPNTASIVFGFGNFFATQKLQLYGNNITVIGLKSPDPTWRDGGGANYIESGSSDTSGTGIDILTIHVPAAATSTWNNGAIANGGISRIQDGGARKLGLAMSGAGTFVLGGQNRYTGGTRINSGILKSIHGQAFGGETGAEGTLTFGPGSDGRVQLNNNSMTIAGLYSDPVTVGTPAVENGAGGTATLTVNNGGSCTFAGVLQNGAAGTLALTKTGAGTLTLSGANSYTGITTINGGVLNLGFAENANVDGPLGKQLATAANTLAFGGGILQYSAANQFDYSGRFRTGANEPIRIDTAGQDVTFATALVSAGGAFMKQGDGTLTLSGANTYSGDTIIRGGVLRLGNTLALQNSTLNYDHQGGSLSFGAMIAATIGGLKGSQNMALTNDSLAGVALTLGGNSQGTTYSGILSGGGSLTKVGSGALTLSADNTYNGPTLISTGKLVFVVGGSCSNSEVTVVTSSATLSVLSTDSNKAWTCRSLTFNGVGTMDFNFGYFVAPGTSLAPIQVHGDMAWGSPAPSVTIEAGSIPPGAGTYPLVTWTGISSGTVPTSAILPPHCSGILKVVDSTLYLQVVGNPQPLTWTNAVGGAWDIDSSFNWRDAASASAKYLETASLGDAVVFDDTPDGEGPFVVQLNSSVVPSSLTVANSAKDYTISGSGRIGGETGLAKTGAGLLTMGLSSGNSYTGATMIGEGTFKLGAANQIPDGAGKGNVMVNGTLDLGGFSDTVNGLSGDGKVDNSAVGAPTLTVGANNASSTFAGAIMNSTVTVAVTKIGAGTWILTGTNTYGGATMINAGSLIITNGGVVRNAAGVVGNVAADTGIVVTVTDTNSLWSLGANNLSFNGSGNTLTITNGGMVMDRIGGNIGGSSNTITVTGDGSVWTNSQGIQMSAGSAPGNHLIITRGGQVYSRGVNGDTRNWIGNGGTGGNKVTVTGAGSKWTVTGGTLDGFVIGQGSSSNGVIVADQGVLICDGVQIGNNVDTDKNCGVLVTGTGSVWSSSGTWQPFAGSGHYITIANGGRMDSAFSFRSGAFRANTCMFRVTDPGSVWNLKGSTLNLASVGNTLNVLDGGSLTNCGLVTLGGAASVTGNSALASNAAYLASSGLIIGDGGSRSNTVTVTGSNTVWTLNNGALTLGNGGGRSNVLNVVSGGVLTNVGLLTVNADNTVNLFGGTVTASALTMLANAQIGIDVAAPGRIVVQGNATLNGSVNPVNLPGRSGAWTILTCSGTLQGSLALVPLPAGFTGNISTNSSASLKEVVLQISRTDGLLLILK